LIHPTSFFGALENEPWRIMESESLQIYMSDTDHYDNFTRQIHNIKSIIKHMNSTLRNGKEPKHDDDSRDSGAEGDEEEKEY
jgi:hypothetical protein